MLVLLIIEEILSGWPQTGAAGERMHIHVIAALREHPISELLGQPSKRVHTSRGTGNDAKLANVNSKPWVGPNQLDNRFQCIIETQREHVHHMVPHGKQNSCGTDSNM
jgi:hypothetical protein